MEVCILGGDKRQLEIIKELKNSCKITLVGYENLKNLNDIHKANIQDITIGEYDYIILPVSGISETYSIKSLFGEDFIVKPDFFDTTKKNAVIITGVLTNKLKEMLNYSHHKIEVLMEDTTVIKENTIPTVEGILADLIYNTEMTINNSSILVIGYGNIAKRLVYFLNMLGAKIAIGVINDEDIIDLSKTNYQAFLTTSKNEMKAALKNVDIIINTAPTLVLDSDYLNVTNKNAYILDVASYPYGVDFNYANSLAIKNKLLPGIPSMIAPKTAGLLLANKIKSMIKEEK